MLYELYSFADIIIDLPLFWIFQLILVKHAQYYMFQNKLRRKTVLIQSVRPLSISFRAFGCHENGPCKVQ